MGASTVRSSCAGSSSLGEPFAAAVSTRTALAYGDTTMTFGALQAAAGRLAMALGVTSGERVALVAPNTPALAIGLFGIWRAGAVAVPLSARLRHFELARVFADAAPATSVSVAAHAGFGIGEEIERLAERTPTLRRCIIVDELGEVIGESRHRPRDDAPAMSSDLAAIMYTSGTTGEPKGALVSHELAGAMGRNLAELLGDDAAATYGLIVPASHAFGLGCLLCGCAAGATAALVDLTASIDPLVRALARTEARLLHGSPALFGRWLRSGAEIRLRGGFTAGSRCAPELLEALDQREMRVLNVYGMTEIGAATACRPADPAETRYRTVGRPLPGYEIRIAGPDGAGREALEPGEIQARSPYLPSGYHGRPWGSNELADGGWFRTGDVGQVDAGGNVMIEGRANEVVHVGGFNVFPAEIESFLLTHPAIAQAAVIGVEHPVLGEALQAFVTPLRDVELEPREVVRFARAGIAGYKVPYVVRVLDELPLLPSGKPDRLELVRTVQSDQRAG